jgi:type IV pilus assembly protein PilE
MAFKKSNGFSLIEVCVVLGLIALLAVLVYPSYQRAVLKLRRSDAQVALMQLLQHQERWRTQHLSYASLSELGLPFVSDQGHYQLQVLAFDETHLQLAAVGLQSQKNDVPCQVLGVIKTGLNITYTAGENVAHLTPEPKPHRCWP